MSLDRIAIQPPEITITAEEILDDLLYPLRSDGGRSGAAA